MKRIRTWKALDLDELMQIAVAFDQGMLALDPDEAQEVLTSLITYAQLKLSPKSAMRLDSVILEHCGNGTVILQLKHRQMHVQIRQDAAGEAA